MTAERSLETLALALLLAACASVPSKVGAYPDHTGRIDSALLVGSWVCQDILPPSSQERLIEFQADHGLAQGLLPKGSTEASQAEDRIGGTWRTIGGYVQTADLHPIAGRGGGLGSELVALVGGDPSRERLPRTLNVLELERQRLVFRNVNSDTDPVVGCRRLPPGDPA
jgi:hypothetical protein